MKRTASLIADLLVCFLLQANLLAATAQEGKPRIIEFTASWCKHCKDLKPTITRLQKKYRDRLDILEVDVNDPDSKQLVKDYRISSLPTVVFEKGNGEFYETFGYNPNEDLDREARALLR